MEFEQMIRIIETVSNSSLTAFHYEANGVKIDMEREAGAAPAGVSPVAAGNMTAGAAAALRQPEQQRQLRQQFLRAFPHRQERRRQFPRQQWLHRRERQWLLLRQQIPFRQGQQWLRKL